MIRWAERRTKFAGDSKPRFGPLSNGISMTPDEFDHGDFEEGYRYELVRGVLIVSPPPLEEERDPNEDLGHLLRTYQETHPLGKALDKTLSEHDVRTGANRRRADRVIWAGLGRMPRRREMLTIVVEFVSAGRRCQERDYLEKRDEYLSCGVREYWVIDRFAYSMTTFVATRTSFKKRVLSRRQTYKTPLLPGFSLPLTRLFALADSWSGDD
jgi:Uma2 family endonuclease